MAAIAFNIKTPSPRRRYLVALLLIFIAALLLLLTLHIAAIRVTTDGPETTYRCSNPLVATMLAATAAMFTSTYLFATAKIGRLRVFAVFPLFLSLIVLFGTTRVTFDYVAITPTALNLPARSLYNVNRILPFANLGGVMIERQDRQLRFMYKDNTAVLIPLGDLVTAALPSINQALESHGIPIVDE